MNRGVRQRLGRCTGPWRNPRVQRVEVPVRQWHALERTADEDAENDGRDEQERNREQQDTRGHAERDKHLARRISEVVGVTPEPILLDRPGKEYLIRVVERAAEAARVRHCQLHRAGGVAAPRDRHEVARPLSIPRATTAKRPAPLTPIARRHPRGISPRARRQQTAFRCPDIPERGSPVANGRLRSAARWSPFVRLAMDRQRSPETLRRAVEVSGRSFCTDYWPRVASSLLLAP